MEKLIVIAVLVIGGMIHNWFQRRQEEKESQNQNRRRQDSPSDGPDMSWEEQMRRLLHGDPEGPSVPPPQPPSRREMTRPPVILAPPPVPASLRRPAAPPPILVQTSIPVPDEGREEEVGLPVETVKLGAASSAYERASHLQSEVAARMLATTSRIASHALPTAPPPGVARGSVRAPSPARQYFADRTSQRAAVVASVILGPPRALES